MADRTVSVKLRAEIDQYRKDMQSAAQATEGVASAAGEAGKASKGMGRLGEAARSFGRTAAVAATAGITAMAAITVGTFKAGAAYNTLEQTSRAALTTLLGSAEAANEQMDILREFGRTSPFPRQIWIEAQQTLIAFGMAAEDVVPTLSAIQDAAAAAGLSSHQIGEIVDVFAKIQSSGRITGRELQQFAIRGIDAAQLLGDAYGKSADQIRNDITSGAIDGREALTLLAEQMSIKFEGAAENVKNTWFGAVDRIKGATRDIGSIIAAPFIDPMGGGAAVQWANDVADALRAFESQLEPVVALLAHRAEPAFQAISDRLQAFAELIRNADFDRLVRDLSGMGPAIAGVGVGVATLGSQSALAAVGLSRMAGAINPAAAGLAAMVAASPELRSVLVDLLNAFTPLIPPIVDLAEIAARSLTPVLQVLAEVMRPVVGLVEVLAGAFSLLPEPVQTALLALGAFKFLGIGAAVAGMIGGLKRLGEQAAISALSIGTAPGIGLRGAATGLVRFLGGPWGIAFAVGVGALSMLMGSSKDTRGAVDELRASLDEATGAITDQTSAIIAGKLEQSGAVDAARKLGIELALIQAAAEGNRDAIATLNTILDGYDRSTSIAINQGRGHAGVQRDQHDAALALRGALGLVSGELGDSQDEWRTNAELLGKNTDATDELTPAQKRLQDQFGLTAEGAQDATAALEDHLDVLKRATDPIFNLIDALEKVDRAQSDYTEAVKEYGRESPEAREASIDLAKAVRDAEIAALNGDISYREFRDTLDRWVRQGVITAEQAKAIEGRVKDARKAAEDYEGEYEAIIRADVSSAVRELDSFIQKYHGREILFHGGVATDSSGSQRRGSGLTLAGGGFVSGPGGPRDDQIPAWLSNGEYVINAASTRKHRHLVESINKDQLPGFAAGGPVTLQAAMSGMAAAERRMESIRKSASGPIAWAASQRGKPYIWGGVGPGGYDCSGFMSAIVNVIKGRNPYSRLGATATFPWGGFTRGQGRFMIGSVKNAGNGIGHMSGTLNGVNVEARGGDGVVVGAHARGANSSLYRGNVWRLQGYKDGGRVQGDPPFDLIDPQGLFVRGSFERGTSRVPMDGLYRLHRDEAVVPADLNKQLTMALQSGLKGSGSTTQINVNAEPEARKIADAVVRRLEQRDLMYGRN